MRRAAFAIVTTTLGLVLLLGFKTHQPASTATQRPGASAQPTPPASGSTGGTSGTGGASPSTGSTSGARGGGGRVGSVRCGTGPNRTVQSVHSRVLVTFCFGL